MSRHHKHCCHCAELPAYFWLASALDVIGYSVNGEAKKGLKCCVINLFTCTYSTSDITTTDSLLSATCTNQALMWETESEYKDNVWAVTAVVCLRLSDETMHCIPELTMRESLTVAMAMLEGGKKNASQLSSSSSSNCVNENSTHNQKVWVRGRQKHDGRTETFLIGWLT